MNAPGWLVLLLVFGAVVAIVMLVAAAATDAVAQRLRTRLLALKDVDESEPLGAIRARYLRQLPPWERWLEQQPGMLVLARLIEQAGHTVPAYRVAFLCLVLAVVAGVLVGAALRHPLAGLVAAALIGFLPLAKLMLDRSERLRKFEEQLPDALDLMTRSLRAGNPLLESFKFVADEMQPPLAADFSHAWSNINFGVSMKGSLLNLLERAPSVSLRAMVTAILVQRETGGNLAEVLDKITDVLRARAKFQRRLKTLTAEGRMSAWVLALMPFGMSGVLAVSSPEYLPMLLNDPLGVKLIIGSLVMMSVGIFWISRIVRIRV